LIHWHAIMSGSTCLLDTMVLGVLETLTLHSSNDLAVLLTHLVLSLSQVIVSLVVGADDWCQSLEVHLLREFFILMPFHVLNLMRWQHFKVLFLFMMLILLLSRSCEEVLQEFIVKLL
jgi:hypothetical protein